MPPKKTVAKQSVKQTDPVEVVCRVRPLDNDGTTSCVKVVSTNTIQLTPPENVIARSASYKQVQNTFQRVFDEFTSQKTLFDNVAMPLVEDVLHGKNGLLFAYGVTNSGKTHTMTGSSQDQGILPRCCDVIFNSLFDLQAKKYVFKPDRMNGFDVQTEADAMLERQRRDIMPRLIATPRTPATPSASSRMDDKGPRVRDTRRIDVDQDNNYSVFVSYVEIYNNYIYDLLEELQYDPITGYKAPTSKILREDAYHNMYVSGVIETEIKSTEEAYDLFCKGQKRRKVANTALNTESSRSHSVFFIRVVQAPLDKQGEEVMQDKDKICASQLALVDLAGSERTLRTGTAGDRLREAGNINQSLMVLRTCIETLRENQKMNANKMVPYRDSRLTHLFKNYFDGEGKVKMIVCVNPSSNEYDETLQVMKFAELTQEVQIARPQEVVFDIGLTPGRRRPKDAPAPGVSAQLHMPEPVVYSLGPSFPSLQLMEASDESTLTLLASYLKEREARRQSVLKDMAQREEKFRMRLVDLEKDNIDLRSRVSEAETSSMARENEMLKLRKRLQAFEKQNEALQHATNVYQQEREQLEREMGEKEWKILQEKMDKDRLRQDYKAKLVLTEQQCNQRIEQTTRKLKQETNAQLNAKQQKLDLLRNIINQDSDSGSRLRSGTVSTARPPPKSRIYPATSEPDLSSIASSTDSYRRFAQGPTLPPATPKNMTQRSNFAPPSAATQPVSRTRPRAKSPPPVKPKPVVNGKFHRRSKSSGEVWLDHRPTGTVEIGTLLQPKMNKRKSVTRLNEKDTRDATKYVLTHQTVDSDGDLQTKLVKGDILTTSAGGTAVVFNDVEVITQKSPGDRKRRSASSTAQPEDFSGSWTDIETRCSVAIEGHASTKKPKTSAV